MRFTLFIRRRRTVSYTMMDVKDFEGRRKPVAQALEALAIKANHFDSPPGHEGFEHTELKSGQEELFVPLAAQATSRSTARTSTWSRGATCWCSRPPSARWSPGPRVSPTS
jgi:hypothetical protein